MLRLAERYKNLMALGELQALRVDAPWPHFVLDGFIAEDQFSSARARVLGSAGDFETDTDAVKIQMQFLRDEGVARFFFSPEVRALLEGLAGAKLTPNEDLAIQLRRMTPESPPFPPHVDRVDKRSLACLYYLADWHPGRGGEIILLPHEASPLTSAASRWVAPEANRLLVFLTEDTHWHAVNAVVDWTRYLIVSEWIIE